MLSRAKHLLLFVCGGEKQILRCAQDDPRRTLYTNTKNGLEDKIETATEGTWNREKRPGGAAWRAKRKVSLRQQIAEFCHSFQLSRQYFRGWDGLQNIQIQERIRVAHAMIIGVRHRHRGAGQPTVGG